ncbi:hypothetical protein RV07_GL004308 [Enterococcus malodoratus]|nr:hypothetical protein RV07_GL004308 [Enterococcus malodoratus]
MFEIERLRSKLRFALFFEIRYLLVIGRNKENEHGGNNP